MTNLMSYAIPPVCVTIELLWLFYFQGLGMGFLCSKDFGRWLGEKQSAEGRLQCSVVRRRARPELKEVVGNSLLQAC